VRRPFKDLAGLFVLALIAVGDGKIERHLGVAGLISSAFSKALAASSSLFVWWKMIPSLFRISAKRGFALRIS
jgi:hypothetical protein